MPKKLTSRSWINTIIEHTMKLNFLWPPIRLSPSPPFMPSRRKGEHNTKGHIPKSPSRVWWKFYYWEFNWKGVFIIGISPGRRVLLLLVFHLDWEFCDWNFKWKGSFVLGISDGRGVFLWLEFQLEWELCGRKFGWNADSYDWKTKTNEIDLVSRWLALSSSRSARLQHSAPGTKNTHVMSQTIRRYGVQLWILFSTEYYREHKNIFRG